MRGVLIRGLSSTVLMATVIMMPVASAQSLEWEQDQRIATLFHKAGMKGSFVVAEAGTDYFTGHNQARAETRFPPASTFKIINTLIGLHSGAIADVDEVLPYGGQPQPFDVWERDMSLREAIGMSNVPIYQELARRVGLESMREQVERIGYGNRQVGDRVDGFWLDGPLEISAVEQVRLLAALASNSLPFPDDVQTRTRELVLLEDGDGFRLYGKTGWQNAPDPGIGWWVGWVERDDKVHAFALNLDIRQAADADKRVDLAKSSLKILGLLD